MPLPNCLLLSTNIHSYENKHVCRRTWMLMLYIHHWHYFFAYIVTLLDHSISSNRLWALIRTASWMQLYHVPFTKRNFLNYSLTILPIPSPLPLTWRQHTGKTTCDRQFLGTRTLDKKINWHFETVHNFFASKILKLKAALLRRIYASSDITSDRTLTPPRSKKCFWYLESLMIILRHIRTRRIFSGGAHSIQSLKKI